MAEEKVKYGNECYLFSTILQSSTTALAVMKNGLKGEITKQTANIIK